MRAMRAILPHLWTLYGGLPLHGEAWAGARIVKKAFRPSLHGLRMLFFYVQ
jgi:hypothetical protein